MFGKKQVMIILAAFAAVLVAMVVVLMTLPKAPSPELTSEPVSSVADAFTEIPDNTVSFTSTVYNMIGTSPLVSVNGMLCRVSTSVKSDEPVPNMAIGDVIEVVYDGRIAESYPGQINFVYAIRLVYGEHSPLTYTLTPKPSAQKAKISVHNDIYYYGLDGMDVTVDSITMDLQQALRVGLVTPEYLLTQAQRDVSAGKAAVVEYKDGGSKLYRYANYAILKMNTTAGDKSLYIGTADLTISALNDPLLEITVSQNKQNKPRRVSTWRTAMETDYVMYFVDVDSVKVKTDKGYQDLLSAVQNGKVDMNTLRSELMAFARESGSPVICADGLLDSTAYTQTTMRFADFTVTFIGHQSRREVFFSPPNSGGFTQNMKERIAEESAKFPLTVKKSASATLTQVTRPEWNLTYDVCYYNIDSASVMLDGKAVDLLDAISQGRLTFEQLIKDADSLGDWIYNAEYKDGGSMLYRYEDYAILKMHTIGGDRSLYIGTVDLDPNQIKENTGYTVGRGTTDHSDIGVNVSHISFAGDAPSVTVVWDNRSGKEITYGMEYHLYRYEGDSKIDCCTEQNHRWNSIAYVIKGTGSMRRYSLKGYDLSKAGNYGVEFQFSVKDDNNRYTGCARFSIHNDATYAADKPMR